LFGFAIPFSLSSTALQGQMRAIFDFCYALRMRAFLLLKFFLFFLYHYRSTRAHLPQKWAWVVRSCETQIVFLMIQILSCFWRKYSDAFAGAARTREKGRMRDTQNEFQVL
jgi:glucan phosphoethanolaminetransferase (alkaline phosphatase superfamily)